MKPSDLCRAFDCNTTPRKMSRFVAAHRALSLLLFRHSVNSLNAQEERLATSPGLVTRLHLPQRCYPHTRNGGHSWCSSSSLSLSEGFSIQDEAVDVARSAPQGAHYYHADVIYLLP